MTHAPTVAILGGGFAGLAAARALQRRLPADERALRLAPFAGGVRSLRLLDIACGPGCAGS